MSVAIFVVSFLVLVIIRIRISFALGLSGLAMATILGPVLIQVMQTLGVDLPVAAVMILALLLITPFPELVTFIPHHLGHSRTSPP